MNKYQSEKESGIYLDYAATTPMDAELIRFIRDESPFLPWANPSAPHAAGRIAADCIEESARTVASLIGARHNEIVWTSGATEANNLAIRGAAAYYRTAGNHLITSALEHASVLESFRVLEGEGFKVTYLKSERNGIITPGQVEQAITPQTILVSLMHLNNEIGTLTDVESIGRLCRSSGVRFHVDAAQSAGKLPLDMARMEIDYLSLSAHKLYGPAGIGALYVRRQPACGLRPVLAGGSQQNGLRPGTLPTHLIAVFAKAAQLRAQNMTADLNHINRLESLFRKELAKLDGVVYYNNDQSRHYGIVHIGFEGIHGESLQYLSRDVIFSRGAACNADGIHRSHVLEAIGIPPILAQASFRFSFGRQTTTTELHAAAKRLRYAVNRLRQNAPRSQNRLANHNQADFPAPKLDPGACGYARALGTLIDHARHSGEIDDLSLVKLSAETGSIEEGGWLQWQWGMDQHGIICQSRYKVWGDPFLMALAEWASREAEGKYLPDFRELVFDQVMETVGLPPNRRQRLWLIEDCLSRLRLQAHEISMPCSEVLNASQARK